MKPWKSPGPDGIQGGFYQHYWPICREVLSNFILNFFGSGTLHPSMNNTFIVLIPKKKNVCHVIDFRPISLCNFSYKIISKIIATRLQYFLPNLIFPTQSAFVKGRGASQKVILAKKVIHSFRKKVGRKGWAMLKIEFNKAFDILEWNFVSEVLHKLGFLEKFIRWIEICFTSVTSRVLVNGAPTQVMHPTRGLRQGVHSHLIYRYCVWKCYP